MTARPIFSPSEVQYLRQQITQACAGCTPLVVVRASGAIAVEHRNRCQVAKALAASDAPPSEVRRMPGEPPYDWARRIVENARAVLGVLPS